MLGEGFRRVGTAHHLGLNAGGRCPPYKTSTSKWEPLYPPDQPQRRERGQDDELRPRYESANAIRTIAATCNPVVSNIGSDGRSF